MKNWGFSFRIIYFGSGWVWWKTNFYVLWTCIFDVYTFRLHCCSFISCFPFHSICFPDVIHTYDANELWSFKLEIANDSLNVFYVSTCLCQVQKEGRRQRRLGSPRSSGAWFPCTPFFAFCSAWRVNLRSGHYCSANLFRTFFSYLWLIDDSIIYVYPLIGMR